MSIYSVQKNKNKKMRQMGEILIGQAKLKKGVIFKNVWKHDLAGEMTESGIQELLCESSDCSSELAARESCYPRISSRDPSIPL